LTRRWKWLGFTAPLPATSTIPARISGSSFTAQAIRRYFVQAKFNQVLSTPGFSAAVPSEHFVTRILEMLVELDPAERLPLGLGVDSFRSTERRTAKFSVHTIPGMSSLLGK